MKRIDYPLPVHELIRQLRRLPGIGQRSAERIALWMLGGNALASKELAESILTATTQIVTCPNCGFFSVQNHCELCAEQTRDRSLLCVVERPTDVLPLDRTGVFRGVYHCLGGRISPLDHIGPEDLLIAALLARIPRESTREVILALGADVEGEATSNYLRELLQPLGVSITRLAQGISAGMGLEHVDDLTLSRALSGRVNWS